MPDISIETYQKKNKTQKENMEEIDIETWKKMEKRVKY